MSFLDMRAKLHDAENNFESQQRSCNMMRRVPHDGKRADSQNTTTGWNTLFQLCAVSHFSYHPPLFVSLCSLQRKKNTCNYHNWSQRQNINCSLSMATIGMIHWHNQKLSQRYVQQNRCGSLFVTRPQRYERWHFFVALINLHAVCARSWFRRSTREARQLFCPWDTNVG